MVKTFNILCFFFLLSPFISHSQNSPCELEKAVVPQLQIVDAPAPARLNRVANRNILKNRNNLMSRNYKFHNPEALYFVSFAVVNRLDVFTRNEYKDIFLESLSFCQREKGSEIIAWCIMTNYVHLVFRSIKGQHPAFLLGDLKRFTSKAIVKAFKENPHESRKEFLLNEFRKAGAKTSNVKEYQFWRHDNKPIELWSNKVIWEKINYIHNNPVEAGLVYKPYDYIYSSALDYSDEKGLVDNVVVFRYYF